MSGSPSSEVLPSDIYISLMNAVLLWNICMTKTFVDQSLKHINKIEIQMHQMLFSNTNTNKHVCLGMVNTTAI